MLASDHKSWVSEPETCLLVNTLLLSPTILASACILSCVMFNNSWSFSKGWFTSFSSARSTSPCWAQTWPDLLLPFLLIWRPSTRRSSTGPRPEEDTTKGPPECVPTGQCQRRCWAPGVWKQRPIQKDKCHHYAHSATRLYFNFWTHAHS